MTTRLAPGAVRDAILKVLTDLNRPANVSEIEAGVQSLIGEPVSSSSVRSYLSLDKSGHFQKAKRGWYELRKKNQRAAPPKRELETTAPIYEYGRCKLYQADCRDWLYHRQANSIHAVVTDPPYGLVEYSDKHQAKLRSGRGGLWRIPPAFDGNRRSPLPRFTTLTHEDRKGIYAFFHEWSQHLLPVLVPGAHVLLASNPLVSFIVSQALHDAGLERRGEVIRLVMTMRGGDRPKGAHEEYSEVSVMPRSMWEPWLIYRKPLEGTAKQNLRKWKTGGLRRPEENRPFGDVIRSGPTRKSERQLANHPSLKPQVFLRRIVRASLPLAEGVVLDTFAGAGSTLAAAEHLGYESLGVEIDSNYIDIAMGSIPKLRDYQSEETR